MKRNHASSAAGPHVLPSPIIHPRQIESQDAGLRAWAPAKINLNLLVGPRREDGYHGLDSIVAKVSLYDRIDVRPRGDGRMTFSCSGADCGPDEGNIALAAARAIAARAARPDSPQADPGGSPQAVGPGADIDLHKEIPPGKGLGGGSSDAAAVLAALDRLWGLGLGAADLQDTGAALLGSDVPLFLGPPASRMTGRGEILAPVRVHPFLAVLILPDCECATAAVYRAFDDRFVKMGEQIDTRTLSGRPSSWRWMLRNDLSAAARKVRPKLGELWDSLSASVGPPVCLTGSGSGLFVLCDDEAEAAGVMEDIRAAGLDGKKSPLGFRSIVVRDNPW